jgi:hypothetical protein
MKRSPDVDFYKSSDDYTDEETGATLIPLAPRRHLIFLAVQALMQLFYLLPRASKRNLRIYDFS